MRTRFATGMSTFPLLILIVLLHTVASQASPAAERIEQDGIRCLVPEDRRFLSMSGLLVRGCADCWGTYTILADSGLGSWGIAPECSATVDWESLVGRRVYIEALTVLVRGGIGGFPGTALGVTRLEVLTPTIEASWGMIRMLYR